MTADAAPVRWGILGVAGINEAMVPALQAAPSAELLAIASRRADRAEQAAADAGIPRAYTGYEALLADPDIEAVYVPVPNAQHAPWVVAAARAGKHVLCEKPMAVTADEARQMADVAAEADVLLAEAFMYVQHPRFAMLRAMLDDGAVGAVRSIHTSFTFDASGELEHSGFQGAPGSGAVYDVGCYAVHCARYLLGAEPEAVTAHAAVSERHGGVDMGTSLLLEFPGGVGVTAHVGMWHADRDTIEIVGATGRVEVPHAFLCDEDQGDFVVTVDGEARTVAVPRSNHYVDQVERFCAAVRGKGALLFDVEDAVQGARILEAATHSWRTRTRAPL